MENRFHFGLKVVIIGQNGDLLRKITRAIPGPEIGESESFEAVKAFTFPLYVSDSLVLRIDLWAVPQHARQNGHAQLLCCDATVVFYVAAAKTELLSLLFVFHEDIQALNPHYRCVCFTETCDGSLTEPEMGITRIESMDPESVALAFKATIATLVNQIPNPPDPVFLLHKNVRLGSLLLDDPEYHRAIQIVVPQ